MEELSVVGKVINRVFDVWRGVCFDSYYSEISESGFALV